jgi:inner membrane protein
VTTIMTHAAVGIALVRLAQPSATGRAGWSLVWTASLASMAADADVLAFRFGIPYEHALGHRGFSHSLVAGALLGAAFWGYAKWRARERRAEIGWRAFAALIAVAVSHPLLDMLTDGGLGCAVFAPFSWERYFFPVTPVPVSPIGPRAGVWGVFGAEILFFWPLCAGAVVAAWARVPKWGRAAAIGAGTASCAAALWFQR